jgi:hypothetical protein
MENLGPATDAMSNKEIIARYDDALKAVIKASTDPQHDADRQIQITQAKLRWEMYLGQHFCIPTDVIGPYGQEVAQYAPFDYTSQQQDGGGAQVKLCPPVNVAGGDAYKYMAVMGANAPRVKGVADDPQDPESMHAGHVADINIRDLWVKQKIDRKWRYLAFHQYVTGPAFIRTFWNTDARKYGQSIEPVIEITDDNGVPMPTKTGDRAYDNGDAEIAIYSIIDCDVPFMCSELDRCSRFRFENMVSKWSLLSRFKGDDETAGPLEQYRDGDVPDSEFTAADSTANEARGATHNPSAMGTIKKVNHWRLHEYWIEPDQYEAAPKEARAVFQKQFPDGLYICKVGDITVEIDNRKVTDEWVVCRVGRADNIMERPILADAVPLVRAIDDCFGLAIETILREITQTFVDSTLVDRFAMNTKEAVPQEMVLVQMPPDGDLPKHFFPMQGNKLNDQVRPFLEYIRVLIQDITGIRPELSGGGPPTQTFREAKQRKDQALQQLAPQAQQMQDAAASVAENLVKLRAKYGSGTVKAQNPSAYGSKTDVADIAELRCDGWHAEADDNFPMTLADRRDAVWSMLKEFPPEVQQALSILDPMNISIICELLQIAGFESAVQEQKEKTLNCVKMILEGQQLQPDVYDNYALADGLLQKWLVGNQQEKNKNPMGFQAVEAYQQAMHQLAMPPAPPPQPPIKGTIAISAKAEDFPNSLPGLLAAAGVPPQDMPPANAPVPPPAQPPAPGDMSSPAPMPVAPTNGAPLPDAGPAIPLPPLTPPPHGAPPGPTHPII